MSDPMYKMVNGEQVAMTEDEKSAELAQREADAAPRVPRVVTMAQARLALLAAGKLADVTTAINALSSPTKEAAQIEWDYRTEVHRSNGLVSQLAGALDLSSSDVDALFIQAATL